jgi:hypothetical protein
MKIIEVEINASGNSVHSVIAELQNATRLMIQLGVPEDKIYTDLSIDDLPYDGGRFAVFTVRGDTKKKINKPRDKSYKVF